MAIIPDPIEPGQRESRYFVQDSGVELARLVEQEQAFTRALGGLIPEQLDQDAFLAPFRRVLDVAWDLLNEGHEHPDTKRRQDAAHH